MSLKKSVGNMYDWVDFVHSHLGGECPNKCVYCYVQRNRFGVPKRYQGEPRLIEEELQVNYGAGRIIFIEHMSDLFAEGIKPEWRKKIINHCQEYPQNQYIFQTKDPMMAFDFFKESNLFNPDIIRDKNGRFSDSKMDFMIGTTIETNWDYFMLKRKEDEPEEDISEAPETRKRYEGIKLFAYRGIKTFITCEPLCDFDVDILSKWIIDANPSFINIGADSKGCGLPEPSKDKILAFVKALQDGGINIRKKSNLGRLLK